jgi:DNA polymerase-3 subunit delta
VVWFKDCNFLGDDRTSKTKDVTSGLADLTAWLKAFDWQGVRLLISAAKCDKRKVFYKAIAKQGHDEEFKALSIDDREWQAKAEQLVTAKLRKLGVKADYGAATELVQMVGPHTRALMSECEKVALYVGARAEVTRDDVRAIVTPGKHAKAFALGDALGDRNLPRLLKRLDEDLWAAKTDRKKSTIGLCSGLISKVRALLFARELLDANMIRPANAYPQFKSQLDALPAGEFPDDRRISPLGLHPYVLFNATRQAKNYTSAELVRALDLLMQANLKLVSSSLDDSFILQSTLTQIAARPAVAA